MAPDATSIVEPVTTTIILCVTGIGWALKLYSTIDKVIGRSERAPHLWQTIAEVATSAVTTLVGAAATATVITVSVAVINNSETLNITNMVKFVSNVSEAAQSIAPPDNNVATIRDIMGDSAAAIRVIERDQTATRKALAELTTAFSDEQESALVFRSDIADALAASRLAIDSHSAALALVWDALAAEREAAAGSRAALGGYITQVQDDLMQVAEVLAQIGEDVADLEPLIVNSQSGTAVEVPGFATAVREAIRTSGNTDILQSAVQRIVDNHFIGISWAGVDVPPFYIDSYQITLTSRDYDGTGANLGYYVEVLPW